MTRGKPAGMTREKLAGMTRENNNAGEWSALCPGPMLGRPSQSPGFPLKTGGNDKGETGGNDKGEIGGNDRGEQVGMTTRNFLPEACFSQFVGLGCAFRAEHGGKFLLGPGRPSLFPPPLRGRVRVGGAFLCRSESTTTLALRFARREETPVHARAGFSQFLDSR